MFDPPGCGRVFCMEDLIRPSGRPAAAGDLIRPSGTFPKGEG